ncbi:MAG: DNA-binding protein [Betaproteobacteria bacterium]|nr:DNA-binding protein [Betaproteobacteria bacterium]
MAEAHRPARAAGAAPSAARTPPPDNEQVAAWLRQAAELLHAQRANPFRVGAYRKAADTVALYGRSLRELFAAEGLAGLDALPGVGPGIAAAIAEMLQTGRWSQLERLRGNVDPSLLFRTVPGIGPELAVRIHDALGVDTLEALEAAAHDGRLGAVPGVGARRTATIRGALAEILDRSRLRRPPPQAAGGEEPPVAMLLDVDREYREGARADTLPTIAPKRFNPDGRAWLPVLHTVRGAWHFTALFSNTAKAHELSRTRDWVVLYFHDDHRAENQRTVVTEQHGSLVGRRVVRGREEECRAHYDRVPGAPPT